MSANHVLDRLAGDVPPLAAPFAVNCNEPFEAGSGRYPPPTSDNVQLSELQRPAQPANYPDPLVSQYILAARAENTRRAYAADLRDFVAWGGHLPSTPDEIARYLARSAGRLQPVTLRRRLAALASAHRDEGLVDPTKHPLVRRVMQGIDRVHSGPQHQVSPLLIEDLARIIARMGDTLMDVRDRALLLVGFFGALRRSEIVALDFTDISATDIGIRLTIRKSKTDQTAKGRSVFLKRRQDALCPARALTAWILAVGHCGGPLFPNRRRDELGGIHALSDKAVSLIVKRHVAAIGLDPVRFSGHSLRAGFATSAALAGVDATIIARQTGHRSQQMVATYVRPADA
jgi:integrase